MKVHYFVGDMALFCNTILPGIFVVAGIVRFWADGRDLTLCRWIFKSLGYNWSRHLEIVVESGHRVNRSIIVRQHRLPSDMGNVNMQMPKSSYWDWFCVGVSICCGELLYSELNYFSPKKGVSKFWCFELRNTFGWHVTNNFLWNWEVAWRI